MPIILPIEDSIVKFVTKLVEEKKVSSKKSEANIKIAQARQKKYFKERKLAPGKKIVKFSIGQKVLLYNARKRMRQGDPLSKSWSGPHIIREVIGQKHVRLDKNKVKRNINHLKPWIFPDSDEEKSTEESASERKQEEIGSSTKQDNNMKVEWKEESKSKDHLQGEQEEDVKEKVTKKKG